MVTPVTAAFSRRAEDATTTADSGIAQGSAMTDRVPHTSDRVAGWKGKIYTVPAHLPPVGWKFGRNTFSVVAVLARHCPCSSDASRDREGKRKRQIFLFSFIFIFSPSLSLFIACNVLCGKGVPCSFFLKAGVNCSLEVKPR